MTTGPKRGSVTTPTIASTPLGAIGWMTAPPMLGPSRAAIASYASPTSRRALQPDDDSTDLGLVDELPRTSLQRDGCTKLRSDGDGLARTCCHAGRHERKPARAEEPGGLVELEPPAFWMS